MKEIVVIVTHYPNHWSNKFMKTNTTPPIKFNHRTNKAKCIELKRVSTTSQRLTYEIII